MKNYKTYIIIGVIILSIIGSYSLLISKYNKVRQDRDIYRNNSKVMLGEIETYKSESGLQVVRVGELQLRISELEKYRSNDIALIKDMRINKKELEQLTKIQQETIYELEGIARDTVFVDIITEVVTTAKYAQHSDEWVDFSCYIYGDNNFKAEINSRDKITYVEHVKYKRFLGFLWRTKKVKKREQSIINENPSTEIVGAEFITIRK